MVLRHFKISMEKYLFDNEINGSSAIDSDVFLKAYTYSYIETKSNNVFFMIKHPSEDIWNDEIK